ncbi:MAG TPA: hypothetical protein VFL04_05160, partial [Rectinemataceae bacterium]|nr:hypothetical protein [Rectinemataceae bacterium]
MRIETYFARPGLDGRSRGPQQALQRALARPVSLEIADVILTDIAIPPTLAREVFCDPVVQGIAEGPIPELGLFSGWDWLVEVAYRPGVTDTLALTAREALEIAEPGLGEGGTVQTAKLYLVSAAGIDREALAKAFSSMWNPLIQSAIFVSRKEWAAGKRLPELYPKVELSEPP